VRALPANRDADFVSFDEHVILESPDATIRAYAVGDHYVETPLDLSGANVTADDLPPPAVDVAPDDSAASVPAITVQIDEVQPLNPNLCAVSGVISGQNLAQAALFQNGKPAQSIELESGASASSMIDALVGSHLARSQQVKFSLRFNPRLGNASIRAYDRSGAYNEQPIVVGGFSALGRPISSPRSLW
jgi:hypothetical protein